MSTQPNTFIPDYIISPGEILEETLEARGIKKREFAERCGRTAKMISEIIAGKAAITPETALQFERVLGVSASLWSNLETKYRLSLAEAEEKENLQNHVKVLDNFPFLKQLESRGFVNKVKTDTEKLANLIKFFGVGGVEALDNRLKVAVSFRKAKTFKSDKYALNTWLRCGEIKALEIDTATYNADKFKTALKRIRNLTRQKIEDALPKAIELCAEAGVALVIIAEIKGACVSGAARWLSKDKALIQLSARGMSDDHFWFTFFHEAAHILLHGKKEIFIDEEEYSRDKEEREADTFSQNTLIPREEWELFLNLIQWNTEEGIKKFAKDLNISEGIVVGQLQRPESDALKRTQHNNLKSWFEWNVEKTTLKTKEYKNYKK